MNLVEFLPALRFLHIVGAFVFVAGHGVSMLVAFRVRGERDAGRMLALLDFSAWSLVLAGVGMLLLLASGILAGIAGNHFGRGWIWVSLALFVVVGGLMTPIAAGHLNRLRTALGQRTRLVGKEAPDPLPLAPEEVARIARGRAPEVAAVIGVGGFLAILWLMTFQPF